MKELLAAARGEVPADLVFKNGKVFDVFNGTLVEATVAVAGGRILGYGDYEGKTEVDLAGRILCPGFIDSHVHIESSMVTVGEFARMVIPLGTTTVFADPHEIANVAGVEGIEFMLEEGKKFPWNFFLMVPSCVPASPFEAGGAVLTSETLKPLAEREDLFGLGEMMNYPGVISGDDETWRKLELFRERFRDGHAPQVVGKELNAYLLGGIGADHEAVSAGEALEKIRAGIYLMIREGSAARNLNDLLKAVTAQNFHRFLFATDDRHPEDLLEEGHINFLIKRAVAAGCPPETALRMATINAATCFGLRDLGAIAPGRRADLLVIDDLNSLTVHEVYKDGVLVAEDGESLFPVCPPAKGKMGDTVKIKAVKEEDFHLPAGNLFRIIRLLPGQIVTGQEIRRLRVEKGQVVNLVEESLAKIAVIERHQATGRIGLGLLAGLGLRRGALATSVAHDAHNLLVTGVNDADMAIAVKEVARMGGGLAAVCDGRVVESLALPVAGLMSERPVAEVAGQLRRLEAAAQEFGAAIASPFMALSFLALSVIPALKITDRGLVDSENFQPVPLVVAEGGD